MLETIEFTVYCTPEPQGSNRAWVVPGKDGGKPRAVVTSANKKLKPYRQELTRAAMAEMARLRLDTFDPPAGKHVPVKLELTFYVERPKSVSKKNRLFPSVAPDLDKYTRSTCDSMKGVLWVDDGQVVDCHSRKLYGTPERVEVRMRVAAQDGPGLPCETLFEEAAKQ